MTIIKSSCCLESLKFKVSHRKLIALPDNLFSDMPELLELVDMQRRHGTCFEPRRLQDQRFRQFFMTHLFYGQNVNSISGSPLLRHARHDHTEIVDVVLCLNTCYVKRISIKLGINNMIPIITNNDMHSKAQTVACGPQRKNTNWRNFPKKLLILP